VTPKVRPIKTYLAVIPQPPERRVLETQLLSHGIPSVIKVVSDLDGTTVKRPNTIPPLLTCLFINPSTEQRDYFIFN